MNRFPNRLKQKEATPTQRSPLANGRCAPTQMRSPVFPLFSSVSNHSRSESYNSFSEELGESKAKIWFCYLCNSAALLP